MNTHITNAHSITGLQAGNMTRLLLPLLLFAVGAAFATAEELPPELLADAERGDLEAQMLACAAAYDGDDYPTAFHWCQQAAHQNHAPAQFLLGAMYMMGHGAAANVAEALAWLQQARANGLPEEMQEAAEEAINEIQASEEGARITEQAQQLMEKRQQQ